MEFNMEMKFVKDEDIKTGAQLKEFLITIQGNVLISTSYYYTNLYIVFFWVGIVQRNR